MELQVGSAMAMFRNQRGARPGQLALRTRSSQILESCGESARLCEKQHRSLANGLAKHGELLTEALADAAGEKCDVRFA